MGRTKPRVPQDVTADPRPMRIPGFIIESDVGLGDAIGRVTRRLGIRTCGGCGKRAAALNRWVIFTKRTR
jgi:hypothetical protein